MSQKKPLSVSDQFRKRADKVAHLSDVAFYADKAGRHYAKDKITRLEAQMMIDAAVGSPWALFMAWCRHTLRTVTGIRRRMDARFRAEELEAKAIADEVAEQLDPAMHEDAIEAAEFDAMGDEDDMDTLPEQPGRIVVRATLADAMQTAGRIIKASR